jgi:hypothetical protein
MLFTNRREYQILPTEVQCQQMLYQGSVGCDRRPRFIVMPRTMVPQEILGICLIPQKHLLSIIYSGLDTALSWCLFVPIAKDWR